MITCTIGPEQGKNYLSKKGYPCTADMGIDNVKAEVFMIYYSPSIYHRGMAKIVFVTHFMSSGCHIHTYCRAI